MKALSILALLGLAAVCPLNHAGAARILFYGSLCSSLVVAFGMQRIPKGTVAFVHSGFPPTEFSVRSGKWVLVLPFFEQVQFVSINERSDGVRTEGTIAVTLESHTRVTLTGNPFRDSR